MSPFGGIGVLAVPPNLLSWVRGGGNWRLGEGQDLIWETENRKSCSANPVVFGHYAYILPHRAWALSMTHVVDHNVTTAGPSW